MSTAEIIRTLRTDRTNTQREIAALIGCSRVSYIDYECGRKLLPLRGVMILADYYSVSSDFILGLSLKENPYPSLKEAAGKSFANICEEYPVNRIIKDIRCRRDLTQRQVADCIGCTQAGYSGYESGRRSIPVDVIVQLSGFYKVSTDYLLGLTYSTAIAE